MTTENYPTSMTLKEMAEIVDQARDAAHYEWELQNKIWQEEQHKKAADLVNSLRLHLPPEMWAKTEELFATLHGAECFYSALTGKEVF